MKIALLSRPRAKALALLQLEAGQPRECYKSSPGHQRRVLEMVIYIRLKVCVVCQETAAAVQHEIDAEGNSQSGVCDHSVGGPACRPFESRLFRTSRRIEIIAHGEPLSPGVIVS